MKLNKSNKTYNHTYNDTKQNQRNTQECDKRNSHISSKFHMIYIMREIIVNRTNMRQVDFYTFR